MNVNSSGNYGTKSQLIRDYVSRNPTATTKEITDALSEYGVSYHLTAKVAAAVRTKNNTQESKSISASNALRDITDIQLLEHGIKFLEMCGSIDKAMEIIAVISRIWSSKETMSRTPNKPIDDSSNKPTERD